MITKIKIPKDVGWLLPGLKVKRWFGLIFIGAIFALLGFCIVFNMEPVYYAVGLLKYIATTVNQDVLGIIFLIVGFYLFLYGWKNTNYSILDLNDDRDRHAVLESLYKRRKLNYGPKIVAIGGGTGLSTMLKGIKKITNNITAVVTVGDDGGSSGRLRQEMGVLPPGDIRNCIAALADDEDLVTKLFQYRFKTGEGLEGHSFGNLFLSALCSITGNMVRAVQVSSKVLSIRGCVLPSTLDDMKLSAEMEDGTIVNGESNIPETGKKIKRLFTTPSNCKALPEVIHAIKDADIIILGPGSLYTSVIPNLLIKEISEAISKSNAKKIYICNIMTQPGETTGYSASEHIQAILDHAGCSNIIEAVLVNNSLPEDLSPDYESSNSFPVVVDINNIKENNIDVIGTRLYEENEQKFVRHSPTRLARAVAYWYKKALKDKSDKIKRRK
jgi:uncharacterized cofD-like protein